MIHLWHRYGPWSRTKAKRRDELGTLRFVEVALCRRCGRSRQRLADGLFSDVHLAAEAARNRRQDVGPVGAEVIR